MENTDEDNLVKIINDLDVNYRNDQEVLTDILDEVTSIAFDISKNNDKVKLFPYIKKAVKAEYLARGSEGMTGRNEGSMSSQFENIIERLESDIVRAGLRRLP